MACCFCPVECWDGTKMGSTHNFALTKMGVFCQCVKYGAEAAMETTSERQTSGQSQEVCVYTHNIPLVREQGAHYPLS